MNLKTLILISLVALSLCGLSLADTATNAIVADVQLNATKGQLKFQFPAKQAKINMLGDNMSDLTQTFTPSATNKLEIGTSVITNGVCLLVSAWTNANSWIDLGGYDANTNLIRVIRIGPGEVHLSRFHPTNFIYGVAVGGTNLLRTIILEH